MVLRFSNASRSGGARPSTEEAERSVSYRTVAGLVEYVTDLPGLLSELMTCERPSGECSDHADRSRGLWPDYLCLPGSDSDTVYELESRTCRGRLTSTELTPCEPLGYRRHREIGPSWIYLPTIGGGAAAAAAGCKPRGSRGGEQPQFGMYQAPQQKTTQYRPRWNHLTDRRLLLPLTTSPMSRATTEFTSVSHTQQPATV